MALAASTTGGLAWGIFIGLVVAVVVAVTKKSWQSWMASAWRNIMSQATVDISGDYAADYWEEGDEDIDTGSESEPTPPSVDPDGSEAISLKQRGQHIEGRITRDAPEAQDRVSVFTGVCADRHITGTYKSLDTNNPERGSFCLKITNGGKVLRGGYLWYNTREGKESIDYGRYVWRRK